MTKEKSIIEHIYHMDDNTLRTFDQFGNEMPEYSGKYEDIIDKINKDKPEEVEILIGVL